MPGHSHDCAAAPLSPARELAHELARWHAQARLLDADTDRTTNDPSAYLRVQIAKGNHARPHKVLATLVLTARHAGYLASCLAGPSAFATSTPPALAEWLAHQHPAEPGTATCWVVVSDDGGQSACPVPIDHAGVKSFGKQLDCHAAWLARERELRAALAIREGGRVQVVGTARHLCPAYGNLGTVIAIKLLQADPKPRWHFEVRLEDPPPGCPTAFREGEIAPFHRPPPSEGQL